MQFFTKNKLFPTSLKIPKFVKWFIQIIHFFSTRLTLFITSKIFATPPSFTTPKAEKGMEESSQAKTLMVKAINKEVHVLTYGYSDKKVLLCHGWAGRSTQLYMIANKLLENGYMVVSFDGPAHGKSTGKETNLIGFIETIKTINEELGPFEAAVGHSFGAMAVINTQAEKEIFKCIVTVGSGDKISDVLINFSNNLGLKNNFGERIIDFFEKKWNLDFKNYDVNRAAKKVKTPALIIHDINDGDVLVSCAINIRQNLEKGSLLITSGLGHTKILRDKSTVNKIINFIKQHT